MRITDSFVLEYQDKYTFLVKKVHNNTSSWTAWNNLINVTSTEITKTINEKDLLKKFENNVIESLTIKAFLAYNPDLSIIVDVYRELDGIPDIAFSKEIRNELDFEDFLQNKEYEENTCYSVGVFFKFPGNTEKINKSPENKLSDENIIVSPTDNKKKYITSYIKDQCYTISVDLNSALIFKNKEQAEKELEGFTNQFGEHYLFFLPASKFYKVFVVKEVGSPLYVWKVTSRGPRVTSAEECAFLYTNKHDAENVVKKHGNTRFEVKARYFVPSDDRFCKA